MNRISFQSVYQTITARGEFKLGQRAVTPDGREWQFVKNNSTIANGNIVIPNTTVSATTCSSGTDVQGRIVYITDTDSSWTTGAYEDGIGLVYTGTGAGQTFKIATNGVTTLTLYPETALTTALSVSDSGIKIITPSSVIIAAITSKLQMTQGAFQCAASSGDYGWILTDGDGRAIAGEALTVGGGFTSGDDTAGQVIKNIATESSITAQTLGYCLIANGSADQGALVRFTTR